MQMPTDEEINKLVFSINTYSAPKPNKLMTFFYQQYWDIVGKGICKDAKGFFKGDDVPLLFTHSYICLVPKKDVPKKCKDSKPISLSDISYKIFFKSLLLGFGYSPTYY